MTHPDDTSYGPAFDVPVVRAAMVHRWEQLTFMHWRYSRAAVQRVLPKGLEVETFDGTAWVGLVPFYLRVSLPGLPPVPWVSCFAETNVRTYVRGAEGQRGIWFFSLDAGRLGAVLIARATYRLPYFWSRLRLERTTDAITYECRRRWPGPRGATSTAVVEPGDAFTIGELDELDHFLTARWALYSAPRSGLHVARAAHDPWPLCRATVVHLDDELVVAAGLPTPTGPPLAHFAPSVEVRIGWPRRTRDDS